MGSFFFEHWHFTLFDFRVQDRVLILFFWMTSLCPDILSSVLARSAICISSGTFLDFNILTPSHPGCVMFSSTIMIMMISPVFVKWHLSSADTHALITHSTPDTVGRWLGNSISLWMPDLMPELSWDEARRASPHLWWSQLLPPGPGGWMSRCILGQPLTLCAACVAVPECARFSFYTVVMFVGKACTVPSSMQQAFFSIDLE